MLAAGPGRLAAHNLFFRQALPKEPPAGTAGAEIGKSLRTLGSAGAVYIIE
jgi:hypothetical protein